MDSLDLYPCQEGGNHDRPALPDGRLHALGKSGFDLLARVVVGEALRAS